MKKTIVLGADHGGFELKNELKNLIEKEGYSVVDFGTHSSDPVDYPDIALLVSEKVSRCPDCLGIIIDGAGVGSAICANKVPGIRAANCHDTYSAKNSRLHNDANVLTLGSRIISLGLAWDVVKQWLSVEFEGGRHMRRVGKMEQIERKYLLK